MVLLASEFDQSRFLKAADLLREKKFRIKEVTAEIIGAGDGKERKLIVWFTNDEHGLVLNKVNNRVLRAAFGDDTAQWIGKIIVVFPTMVDMRGRMVPALRVRIPPPKQTATTGNGQTVTTTAAITATPLQSTSPSQSAQAPQSSSLQEQLDEFGQSQSAAKPSLTDELDDEIGF